MTLLSADIKNLIEDISITVATPDIVKASHSAKEPYRYLLKELDARIADTLDWITSQLFGSL